MSLFSDIANNITKLHFSEGIVIDDKNEFLKKYDKNNNSIFDRDEILNFKSDLLEAAGEDLILNEDETKKMYMDIMGISLSDVNKTFSSLGNIVYNSIDSLIEAQARTDTVKQFISEAEQSEEIYYKAIGGKISKGINNLKELLNSEYAGDKIFRQIVTKKVSGLILEKANKNNGLTAKDYILMKISLLKGLLGLDKFPQNEQKEIEDAIMMLKGSDLNNLITNLTMAENNEFSSVKNNILSDLKLKNKKEKSDYKSFKNYTPDSIGYILNYLNAERKITFEKLFFQETGEYFDPIAIENYEQVKLKTTSIINTYNKVSIASNDLAESISLINGFNRHGGSGTQTNETEAEQIYTKVSSSIISTLKSFYEDDTVSMLNFLNQFNAQINSNKILFNNVENHYAISKIAEELKFKIETGLNKQLNNKTIDDYDNEYKESYINAFGDKNIINLASKFAENQQDYYDGIKMGISLGSVIILLCGPKSIALPIISAGLNILSAPIMDYIEGVSKEGGLSGEDAEKIKNELIFCGVLTILAYQEGKLAAEIGKKLLNCSEFMESVGTYGSMSVMSALTNYAIMGDIDLSHECISNLLNIAIGMLTHNKINKAKINANKQNNSANGIEFNVKRNYSKQEIKSNIEAIKARNFNKNRSNLDFIEYNYPEKYGIYSYKDLLKSELITSQEKKMIKRIYKNAKEQGYQSFLDENLDILIGFARSQERKSGKIVSMYENLDANQYRIIKYAREQLLEGKIDERVLQALDSRIKDSVPIEVYQYVDCPEKLPQKVYSKKDKDLWWTKEDCLNFIENIKILRDFLNTQSTPVPITTYRVQGYSVLSKVKIGDTNLADLMQNSIKNETVDNVIAKLNEGNIYVKHENHLGTSLASNPPFDKQYPINWEIEIPAGSKGIFLESSVRENAIFEEREFLIQMNSTFRIKNAQFINGSWFIKVELIQ